MNIRLLALSAVAAAGVGAVIAQSPTAAFEAVSIKPSPSSGDGIDVDRHPGIWVARNVALQDCIREAYGVTDPQIVSQTRLRPDRYDIMAKMPEGASQASRPAMLQTMLAERFKLVVHHGTQEMPVYGLVVAKGGPKIQPVEAAANGGMTSHAGSVSGVAVTMARLASFLSGARAQLDHTVIDRTGLQGLYTFTLDWTPEEKLTATGDGVPIRTALQEQLGLRLEPGKAPVEILIVDHAELPSAN